MKFLARLISFLFFLAVAAVIIYGLYYLITLKRDIVPSFSPEPTATSTPAATTTAFIDLDQFNRAATSSWKTYENMDFGYTVKYPVNLIATTDNQTLTLTFPKDKYFSWPLLDNVAVTVSVASTCPDLPVGGVSSGTGYAGTFILNGNSFSFASSTDRGAGQVYEDIVFDTNGQSKSGKACYRLNFLDHSVNGAGFYVDDQTLIKKYDSEHAVNEARVKDIFYGIVNSFRLTSSH